MADVKWIKIVTDIFDDEKMILIESMPEADSIIVIWFKLLCMAGKQNNSGVFMLNDKIAYTDEMLSTVFRRPLNTVRLALNTFEAYGMIEIVDNVVTIPNWEKHQSLDKLELAKEKNRKRVAAHREKQKQLACNDYSNVTVTECNADRIDKDKDKNKNRIDKEVKNKYGTFNNVLLTPTEYNNLLLSHSSSEVEEAIEYLSEYLESTGKKYKSHNLVLKRWVFDAVKEKHIKETEIKQREARAAEIGKQQSLKALKDFYGREYEQREYTEEQISTIFSDLENTDDIEV